LAVSASHFRRASFVVGLVLAIAALVGAPARQSDRVADGSPSLRITSPLGRTGLVTTVHIVAQISIPPGTALSPVQFFVDGKSVGSVDDGPPYAVTWTDDNPFEKREIQVQATASNGAVLSDSIVLPPYEVAERAQVTGVLLETSVYDRSGHFAAAFDTSAFTVLENGVKQTINQVAQETIPSDLVLLVDNSTSMSRRMEFVRSATERLAEGLKPKDRVIVAPFTSHIETITGPTNDRATVSQAIGAMRAGGTTALLDSLQEATRLLQGSDGRRAIVLITDGYDEKSKTTPDEVLKAIEEEQITVYSVAIGGVAGISLRGEDLLRRFADASGGRVFLPPRDSEVVKAAEQVATDARNRFLITYTPSNQRVDGTWREVNVDVPDGFKAKTRAGYFAPKPPPIRPRIEFTVKNSSFEYVGVTADDIDVLEDGVEQKVDTFQEAVDPVSIVLALDASGSMKKSEELVRQTATEFVRAVRPEDSLALMLFADQAKLAHALALNRKWSFDAIDKYIALGGTALYDALWGSFQTLKGVAGRHAVVVLTDGRDENNPGTAPGSVHTFDEVLTLGKQVGASVFAVALGTKVDTKVVDQLVQASGGQTYVAADAEGLSDQFRRVVEDLRRRYVLGYTSTNSVHDGSWRTVEIRPKTSGRVAVTNGGYFAPDN
jgi:Ca-activated chloride channel family protein